MEKKTDILAGVNLKRGRLGLKVPRCLAAGALFGISAHVAQAATNLVAYAQELLPKPPPRHTQLSFGLDRIPWLRGELFGNPLWQYIASLIFIILSFYGTKVLDYLVQAQLRRWAARTQVKFNDLVVTLLRGPVRVISFVILLHFGLRLFAWPEWEARVISNCLQIIVGYSLTYLALKLVDLIMGVWKQRVEVAHGAVLDVHLLPTLRKCLKIFVVVVAVLVVSQNLGMNITGLLASLSIGGLAVGLAAQDTLSNLFGAVAIFADKPFRVGDYIQLDSIQGTVENIGLRSTRVRNPEGSLVTVPNKTMAAANIVNFSRRPGIRTVINIGLTYDTPAPRIERAMAIIGEIFRADPKTADLQITFNKFAASALNIEVSHLWNSTDASECSKGIQKLALELKRRFDEEQIGFAFPSQTIYLRHASPVPETNSHPDQAAASAPQNIQRLAG